MQKRHALLHASFSFSNMEGCAVSSVTLLKPYGFIGDMA